MSGGPAWSTRQDTQVVLVNIFEVLEGSEFAIVRGDLVVGTTTVRDVRITIPLCEVGDFLDLRLSLK